LLGLCRQRSFPKSTIHQAHPSVAGSLIYMEWRMPRSEARMASLFDVRSNLFRIVVGNLFETSDVPDRANRSSTHLANSFCNVVGHCEYLLSVLIQHQVIIAKMSTADSQWKFLVLM
jgi:hypothetical protein